MHVAAVTVELRIRDMHSLKEKRRVVKSIIADIGKSHPVAIAEVDHQDLWQRSTLGIAAISTSPGQVERMLRAINNDLDARDDVELLGVTTSYLEPAEQ
ncbi:MAG: DUF503 domain-containing protein [Acidimicrobiia bacterium]|nr:MAG: DUF503 domain-containing protein [Acidimicrobiia bacterium]